MDTILLGIHNPLPGLGWYDICAAPVGTKCDNAGRVDPRPKHAAGSRVSVDNR
jgi:hypothetical protein